MTKRPKGGEKKKGNPGVGTPGLKRTKISGGKGGPRQKKCGGLKRPLGGVETKETFWERPPKNTNNTLNKRTGKKGSRNKG